MRNFTIDVRVRYTECDPMRVVHHSRYLVYFEMARVELFRANGGDFNALEKSGKKKYHPESAKKYGTWDVPKCYIHVYEKNQVVFDWQGMTLEAFGGKTAYEVADEAWLCHLSQVAIGKYKVFIDGDYDSRVFGLYLSKVGPDREHNDLFENLPDLAVEVEED